MAKKISFYDLTPFAEIFPFAIRKSRKLNLEDVVEELVGTGVSKLKAEEIVRACHGFLRAAICLDKPKFLPEQKAESIMEYEFSMAQENFKFSDDEIESFLKLVLDEINNWSEKRKEEFVSN